MNKKGKFTAKAKNILHGDKPENLSSFLDNFEESKIYEIDIEMIKENPNQPRKYFNEEKLSELSDSIKKVGIIQPIIVKKDKENMFILVAGERRLRASKRAGLKKISTIITTGNPLEISLIENIQRENLKPIEEAEAFKKMIDEHKYTQQKLASVIGKGRTTITETLSLNKLPKEIKQNCRHADISKRALVEIAKQESADSMIKLYNKVIKKDLKSNQVRKLTRKKNEEESPVLPVIKKVISTYKSIKNFNYESASELEKKELNKELVILKEIIEKILI